MADDSWSFQQWLDRQRALQRLGAKFGVTQGDPGELHGKARDDYLRWNALAAHHELVEMVDETSWKPWADDDAPWNREEFITEAVDVLHFLGNMLLCENVTGAELSHAYAKKLAKNAKRWEEGYRGRLDKCPGCKRDLTELPEGHTMLSATLCRVVAA